MRLGALKILGLGFSMAGLAILHFGCGKGAAAYRYIVPQQTNDGWETASLESEHVDPTRLAKMFERINSRSYRNNHSVLVVKNGKLIVEEYFPGRDSNGKYREFNREMRHEMHSVTKSVVGILAGIALDHGFISGVDEKVSTLFPEYGPLFADHARDDLRLKHLLTMSAGLSWDEWSHPYSDSRNDLAAMDASKDLIRYVLERPVAAKPGEKFAYSGGDSMLLGEIVNRRAGLATDQFAERHLFEPLGISDYKWWKYANGMVDAGGGLVLRPRDMAKIGSLFLNGGRWHGKQIVSEQWVKDSTINYIDARQFPSWIKADGYGYQWWRRSFQVNGKTIPSWHAAGRGGQFIFIFPSLETIAVFTSWNDDALGVQPFDMVERYLLPSVLK